MLAAGIKTPVPLEELEIHLREDIERQMKSGLDEQKVFENAVQEIGRAQMLKNEFEKVDGRKELRALKRDPIIMVACQGLIALAATAFLLFNSELTFAQRISGLAAVAVMILFTGIGLLSHSFFPAILDKRARGAICILSGLLLVVWKKTVAQKPDASE